MTGFLIPPTSSPRSPACVDVVGFESIKTLTGVCGSREDDIQQLCSKNSCRKNYNAKIVNSLDHFFSGPRLENILTLNIVDFLI
jgi:hypothetical protein